MRNSHVLAMRLPWFKTGTIVLQLSIVDSLYYRLYSITSNRVMDFTLLTERKTSYHVLSTKGFGSGFTMVFCAYFGDMATLYRIRGSHLQLRSRYVKLFRKLSRRLISMRNGKNY